MTRHFYKHRATGVVSALNDSFAAVFGDRFERVGDTTVTAPVETREVAQVPAPVEAEANAPVTDPEVVAPATAPAVFETDDTSATTADAPKEASN